MSSFLDSYGRLGPGAFAVRIVSVIAVWAGLVFVMLHYVGKVWPHEYQIREAEEAQADENARNAAEKPAALTPATGNATAAATTATGNVTATATPAAGSPGTPVVASTAAAPAAGTAAPAPATSTATAPAPAAATSAPAPAAMTAPTTGAAPAAGTAAPATASAAPATSSAAPATSATPGKPEVKEPPRDSRLDGYDRHAFFNVAIFYSIVISVLSSGAALSQIIKRLRDLGWNGMLSVLFLVPGVNVLFVLALMFTPGKPAPQPAH